MVRISYHKILPVRHLNNLKQSKHFYLQSNWNVYILSYSKDWFICCQLRHLACKKLHYRCADRWNEITSQTTHLIFNDSNYFFCEILSNQLHSEIFNHFLAKYVSKLPCMPCKSINFMTRINPFVFPESLFSKIRAISSSPVSASAIFQCFGQFCLVHERRGMKYIYFSITVW